MSGEYGDVDEGYGKARYSFTIDADDFGPYVGDTDIGYIRCVDRRYVEVGYTDGRRVRYLYNRAVSEG